jgi:hypothetical protein
MSEKQVVTPSSVFGVEIAKMISECMSAESKARKHWANLAMSLHDQGVLVAHLVQPTEGKPNESFNLGFFTGLRSIIVANLERGYRDVMLNSSGSMTAKSDVQEGFPRKTWEAGNKEVKGFFGKIREHLRRIESEEADGMASSARMLKCLVNDTLKELSVQVGKMPEKRQDATPFDVQVLIEVCRKAVAALK